MHIDRDGSGDISKRELRKAFQTKGTKRTEKEWEEILNEIDKDGNDLISLSEFISAMEKVLQQEDTHSLESEQ